MSRKRRRKSKLARGAESPAVRTLAASAALAGGVTAAAKLGTVRANGSAPPKPKLTKPKPKAKPRYRLEPGETPKQGVSRVARGELDLTIELLQAAPQGAGGAEAVHDARKSLKRLRALLRVSRPAFEARRYRRESAVLHDAGRQLADQRDAQVLLETLDSLLARFGDELPAGTWDRLHKKLARSAGRAQAKGRGGVDRVLHGLGAARERLPNWSLPNKNGRAALAKGFEQIYRHGRRALRQAEMKPTAQNFHELRKRGKDLWHAAQLLQRISPAEMKALSQGAHRLSDLLGDEHDLSVLLDYADEHPKLLDQTERRLLECVVELRRLTLRREAITCAESIYRRKPKKMLRRLSLS
jgi:CHAD domain-containing protein